MNIASPAQVSRVIDDTVAAANAIFVLKDILERYNIEQSTNLVHDALTAQGAVFPPQFSLTPVKVEDARYALAVFRDSFITALTPVQPNLDAIRLALGVLVGTG